MTRHQAKSFINLGFIEKDCYKGKVALEKYALIDYGFVKHWDNMVSDAKKIWKGCFVLVHDFNQYTHGGDSAHYGDPKLEGNCVAVDYHFTQVPIYNQLMLAFKWNFDGIFFYPHSKVPFMHVDWKDWNRPLGIITFGYRDREGNMITSNNDFDKVIDMINFLCELTLEDQNGT